MFMLSGFRFLAEDERLLQLLVKVSVGFTRQLDVICLLVLAVMHIICCT